MAKSDLEEAIDNANTYVQNKLVREADNRMLERNDGTIHSGHFMLSRIHDREDAEESESSPVEEKSKGFDFGNAIQTPAGSYQFGYKSTSAATIDASLTGLFQSMTLAYR